MVEVAVLRVTVYSKGAIWYDADTMYLCLEVLQDPSQALIHVLRYSSLRLNQNKQMALAQVCTHR